MEDKVLMYPGADEVELTLLARMLNVLDGRQPKVYVKYTSEMATNIIPLYEGCTLANTVKYHILSAGCLATESYESADIVLFMTAPCRRNEEQWNSRPRSWSNVWSVTLQKCLNF